MIESIFKQISGTVRSWMQDGAGNALTSRDDGAGQRGLSVELSTTNFVFSSGNSSTAQLAAGATFTGAVEIAIYQQNISLLLTSDQNGILTVNQYIDAAGARNAHQETFNIYAGVGFSEVIVLNGNYFNLTFKNTGSATTTTLNINTYQGTLAKPVVATNPQNDYLLNVQRGRVTGHSNVSLTGYNSAVGNSKEMLWAQSGTYTWKTSASTCTIASSSASDAAAGTGARTVLISGLDSSYGAISEIIALNGTSNVTTVNSYLRVNMLTVLTAGSATTNIGNITLTHTGTAINYIAAGDGLSQSCFYTVPLGHKVFILSGYVRSSKIDQLADLYVQAGGVKYKVLSLAIASSDFQLSIRAPYEVPQTADIWIECAAAAGSLSATGFLEMIQIKDGF